MRGAFVLGVQGSGDREDRGEGVGVGRGEALEAQDALQGGEVTGGLDVVLAADGLKPVREVVQGVEWGVGRVAEEGEDGGEEVAGAGGEGGRGAQVGRGVDCVAQVLRGEEEGRLLVDGRLAPQGF